MVQDTLVRYRVQIAKASSPLLLPDHFQQIAPYPFPPTGFSLTFFFIYLSVHCIVLSDEITINDGPILSQCETRYLIIPVFQNSL